MTDAETVMRIRRYQHAPTPNSIDTSALGEMDRLDRWHEHLRAKFVPEDPAYMRFYWRARRNKTFATVLALVMLCLVVGTGITFLAHAWGWSRGVTEGQRQMIRAVEDGRVKIQVRK